MNHFFIREHQLHDGHIHIIGEDAHHIRNVLRLRNGEEASFSVEERPSLEYRGIYRSADEEGVVFEHIFTKDSEAELPVRVTLYQGLPKGDKLETIIQKSVELGVSEIVPVACERSIVRLDDKKGAKKRDRWQGIALSAAKQSHRGLVPQVLEPLSYREAMKRAKGCDHIFIPYEKAEDMGATRALISDIKPGESVAFFIGPEGGFSTGEVEQARECGAKPITLGNRILRTETAAMVFLAFLSYTLE